jgi:hypothetical protein
MPYNQTTIPQTIKPETIALQTNSSQAAQATAAPTRPRPNRRTPTKSFVVCMFDVGADAHADERRPCFLGLRPRPTRSRRWF